MARWNSLINFCRSTGYSPNWRPLPSVDEAKASYLDGSDFGELYGVPADVMIYFCRWLGYWPTDGDKVVRRAAVVRRVRLGSDSSTVKEGLLPWIRRERRCPNGDPLPAPDDVRSAYLGGDDFSALYGYALYDVKGFCVLCGWTPSEEDEGLRHSVLVAAYHAARPASDYREGSMEWCRRSRRCPNGLPLPSVDKLRASYVRGDDFEALYGYTGPRLVNFCRMCGYEPSPAERSERKRVTCPRGRTRE